MTRDLKSEALRVFEDIQSTLTQLEVSIDTHDPNVEISVAIPRQSGLDFDVLLNFQNGDELHMAAGANFWFSWFPLSDPQVVERFRDAVLGLISGRFRIVEYYRRGRWVGGDLQVSDQADAWKRVAASRRGRFAWRAKKRILRNTGHPTTG